MARKKKGNVSRTNIHLTLKERFRESIAGDAQRDTRPSLHLSGAVPHILYYYVMVACLLPWKQLEKFSGQLTEGEASRL